MADKNEYTAKLIADEMPHSPYYYDARALSQFSIAERWTKAAIRHALGCRRVRRLDVTPAVKMYLSNMAMAELERK